MPATEESVTVTVTLPREVYEQATQAAAERSRSLDDVVSSALSQDLDRVGAARAAWDRASALYRARLAAEGKLDQSEEEIWEEMRRIREEVANEFYP